MLGGPGNRTVTAMALSYLPRAYIKPVTTQCFGGHRTGWRPDTSRRAVKGGPSRRREQHERRPGGEGCPSRKGTGMLERMEGPGCSGQAGEDVHLFLQVVPPRS